MNAINLDCWVVLDDHAPSEAEFENLIGDLKDKKSTLGDRKSCKKTWCIAEAIKKLSQEAVLSSELITLFRDESQMRLSMRFKCVNDNLSIRRGFLGHTRGGASDAKSITIQTHKIVEQFATRWANAPCNPKRTQQSALSNAF